VIRLILLALLALVALLTLAALCACDAERECARWKEVKVVTHQRVGRERVSALKTIEICAEWR